MVYDLLGMIKFSHTLFALPFALFGAALAARGADGWHGRPRDWLGILLCMATARSAAMAFNRLVDRRIDALNPRTATRHIPSGQLSASAVAAFCVVCALGFVASTLLFLPNRLPVVALGAGAGVALRLLVREAVHQPVARVARLGANAFADRGVDRLAGRPALAAGLAGACSALLGHGLRRDLRVPGRGVRPRKGSAQHPPAVRREERPEARRARTPRDGRLPRERSG